MLETEKNERKRTLFFLLLLLLQLPLYAGLEVPICTNSSDQGNPVIWGDKIVWQDYRKGNWDIYMYDLTQQKEIAICENSADQHDPAIYKDKIVWVDRRNGNWDIYMYDLSRGEERQITNTPDTSEMYPAIYDNKIVWVVVGSYEIHIYDIATKQDTIIGRTYGDPGRAPSIYGDKVVWMDWRYGDPDISKNPVIFMYDLTLQKEIRPIEGYDQWSPAIYEDKIVWINGKTGKGDVYLYDLKSQQQIPVCIDPQVQFRPAIYGDKIVWVDYRNADPQNISSNPDIYMYDLKTNKEIPVCLNLTPQQVPNIYEGKVVWQDWRNNNWDIYMFLPSFPSSFQKKVDKTSAFIGENLTYTITCKNEGAEALENITISDKIPLNTEYIEGSATGNPNYDSQQRKLIWSISSLDTGSQISLSFSVKATKEGTVSNEATLIYSGVSQTSNKVSTIIKVPQLSISKAVDKISTVTGEQLTYTITFKNDDNIAFLNIVITDALAQNCEYVAESATGNPTYDTSKRTLTWQIASLNAGSETKVSFKVKVLGGEKISNKATLTYQGYSIDSNEVSTTITIPTVNAIEDVNFSFDAGLFEGIYLEEGVSISNFGLKGAEAAVGAISGKGLNFAISNSNNIYGLGITQKNTTGMKIEGGLGKIGAGPINLTALKEGLTASILNDYFYLFSNPLNDADQSANALALSLSSASSFGYSVSPGVGSFVDAITAYFSPLAQYADATANGAQLEGSAGVLSLAIGTGKQTKAEISNDVLGAYISGKVETLTKLHPTGWKFQDSFQIACGGNIGVPFIYGKSGQASFTIGYRGQDIQNPSQYFYCATLDEGTNIPFTQLHTIHSYEVECEPDLCEQVAQQIVDNALDAIVSGDLAQIQPQRVIQDALNFENLLAKNASEGEAVYRRNIEEATQVELGFNLDIGGSLGIGGGIRIGISGQVLTSSSYPTEEGELINGGRVLLKKFNRVQSDYRGPVGIANFYLQMINRALSVSDFINCLKNFFKSIIQSIQQGVENTVEWVEGGVEWVVDGVTDFFSISRGIPQAEMVHYGLKSPRLLSTTRGYSIGFVPYRSPNVVMLSRQPAREFTGMKYAVNLNIKKGDGSYVSSFPPNSNRLRIEVGDDQLMERGFAPTDWQSLNIFWYDPSNDTWYQLTTTRTRKQSSTILEASPQKPGTYSAGIASLPPDREAPKITIISPQNSAKTSPTPLLSAIISDPNLKESTIKFYLDGKEVQPIYRYIDRERNQFLALPPQPLSQGSHTFKVFAEDNSQNKGEVSVSFTVLPPKLEQKVSFLSLPFVPTESLSQLMEFEQSAVWTGTNYNYSNDPYITPFQGFWLKTSQEFSPSKTRLMGYALEADEEISIPLTKGWQAIGLPWNYLLPLSGVKVEKNGVKIPFSEAGNLIGLMLFRWDGTGYKEVGLLSGMEDTLYPWFGYWVRVKEDCRLLFPKEPWSIKAVRASSKYGFAIPIKAVFPDGTSEEVYLGMAKEEISSPFPPPPPYQKAQRRMALLRNGELLLLDVRKEGVRGEWELLVKGEATLLFPNLSLLPKGWQVILQDGDKRYYLKTTSALRVEGEKRLKIEVGEGLITPLLISMLDVGANRGGMNIVWSINKDCDVKLVVRAPDGRLVRDLGARRSSAGANSLFWDGKSWDGRNLPSGIYIIELTARDDMNQMVKAIKGVILR